MSTVFLFEFESTVVWTVFLFEFESTVVSTVTVSLFGFDSESETTAVEKVGDRQSSLGRSVPQDPQAGR